MIGDLFDSPWKILIIAVVLIVLFGSKKLPEATRSLGRSMRILKTEVQGLHGDDDTPEAAKPVSAQQQQIDQLQLQLRELQQQPPAAGQTATAGQATVAGAPLQETQRTQQPG
jgi:sec-independent protein translocase protein TatA